MTCNGALVALLLLLGCEGPSESEVAVPERSGGVVPAARGAVGAYARSGGTPWTRRAGGSDAGSGAPGPRLLPPVAAGPDGGVTL